ncbi:hypothetical protein KMI_09g14780 [Encephalitozoon hellem]|nr:hypothetical protein KMI_09g14780 [Encephalitozoon hellem]
MACYKIRRDDYGRYVDETPFLAYTSMTLIMTIISVFSMPSLFIYSFIPMFMAVAIRSPAQGRAVLLAIGCMLGLMVPVYLKK